MVLRIVRVALLAVSVAMFMATGAWAAAAANAPGLVTTGPSSRDQYWMGTVSRVDPSTGRVTLSDGTIVQLRAGARPVLNGRPSALGELRPGDEVVVGVPSASSAAAGSGAAGGENALPRAAVAPPVVQADELRAIRR